MSNGNNVTPIRPPAPTQQDWGLHPMNPIWPMPPWPPQPGCGPSPPGCFSAIAKADACWDSSKELYCFLTKVITDIFKNDPSIIPPPPPSAGSGPIIGVTDGSNAAPGDVGEFIQAQASVTYPAAPSNTVSPASVMVLQPGDWDIYAALQTTNYVDGLVFDPNPPIVGLQGILAGSMVVSSAADPAIQEYPIVTGNGRGNFTVPTLLTFNVQVVNSSAGLVAGTAYLNVWARRRR